ncbi:MAG TPA: nucleoside triphosphate pyrophosphohydrolase [Candidatus Saccharimonadales bacterium]|nr:nucleoside triphosphate pyrophosphohydrolase [Candidatus Saccharimonadales bacterium]
MIKTFNKLVRDKIPEICRANNETPVTRALGDDEYLHELICKLAEESEEFKEALNVEELADIQEVVLALVDVIASRTELEAVRVQKAEKRGVFKDKIFLERVE